jgi:hypothetical protein
MWPYFHTSIAAATVRMNRPTITNPMVLRSMPPIQSQIPPDQPNWSANRPSSWMVPIIRATATDSPVITMF